MPATPDIDALSSEDHNIIVVANVVGASHELSRSVPAGRVEA